MVALLAGAPAAVVVKPVANMYSAPSERSDVVSQAILGSNVSLAADAADAADKDGWVKIRTEDNYNGWVQETSLRRLGAGERPYASAGRVARVASLFANLYHEPDVTKRQPLLTVPFETPLEVLSEPEKNDGRWIEVRLPDERTAWIQRGDVAFDSQPLEIGALIELARRFDGLPYLWGGTSSFGFDCSGFTQMLCRRRGTIIPRDAAPQARWEGMAPIERSELQPGDFLYFGPSPEKITHSGMYIGGGEFIHATTHERPVVQISRLDEPHWSKLLVACRRLK